MLLPAIPSWSYIPSVSADWEHAAQAAYFTYTLLHNVFFFFILFACEKKRQQSNTLFTQFPTYEPLTQRFIMTLNFEKLNQRIVLIIVQCSERVKLMSHKKNANLKTIILHGCIFISTTLIHMSCGCFHCPLEVYLYQTVYKQKQILTFAVFLCCPCVASQYHSSLGLPRHLCYAVSEERGYARMAPSCRFPVPNETNVAHTLEQRKSACCVVAVQHENIAVFSLRFVRVRRTNVSALVN